ncbi:MAG: type II toxin-antitoxin system RelE/ParE family toxin [Candidatus Pacebacteria bacterium]|nr:type II toxin-antitoxin system RelE/ParE family toxin [Candidatus Paceibacterota bacterium]
MELIYFVDKILKYCPVKLYLEKYLPSFQDNLIMAKRKQKILADIDAKLSYIKENKGMPTPPISKPLRGYSFFEILNTKDSKTVIRILYFCYQNKLVLLHAFEKPSSYSKEKERRWINRQYQIAQKYVYSFKLNPQNYEKYK